MPIELSASNDRKDGYNVSLNAIYRSITSVPLCCRMPQCGSTLRTIPQRQAAPTSIILVACYNRITTAMPPGEGNEQPCPASRSTRSSTDDVSHSADASRMLETVSPLSFARYVSMPFPMRQRKPCSMPLKMNGYRELLIFQNGLMLRASSLRRVPPQTSCACSSRSFAGATTSMPTAISAKMAASPMYLPVQMNGRQTFVPRLTLQSAKAPAYAPIAPTATSNPSLSRCSSPILKALMTDSVMS